MNPVRPFGWSSAENGKARIEKAGTRGGHTRDLAPSRRPCNANQKLTIASVSGLTAGLYLGRCQEPLRRPITNVQFARAAAACPAGFLAGRGSALNATAPAEPRRSGASSCSRKRRRNGLSDERRKG